MIYQHVETNAASIYIQTKILSTSEIAAMIQDLLRHDTDVYGEKNFVVSHAQSEVTFAVCHLMRSSRLRP